MLRERALKIVLVMVGLLFVALVYPLTMFFSREPALAWFLVLLEPSRAFRARASTYLACPQAWAEECSRSYLEPRSRMAMLRKAPNI